MSEYKLSDRMERILKAMYDSEKGITHVLYVDNGNIYTVREHIITGAREETANAWQIEIDELANMGLLYGSPEQNYILTRVCHGFCVTDFLMAWALCLRT